MAVSKQVWGLNDPQVSAPPKGPALEREPTLVSAPSVPPSSQGNMFATLVSVDEEVEVTCISDSGAMVTRERILYFF